MSLRKLLRGKGVLVLPGLAALLIIALLQFIGFAPLDRVGLLLFDSYQRAAPRAYEDAPVRIVDIDDETVRRLGQWPWPRTDVAKLTQRLTDAGASAIAFDIVFSEPDRTSPTRLAERLQREHGAPAVLAALRSLPDNDAAFAEAIGRSPVTLGYFLTRSGKGPTVEPKAGMAVAGSSPDAGVTRYTNALQPLAPLRTAARGLGFVSLTGDSDGILRKAPLIAAQNGQLLPSLAVEALRTAQGAGSVIVKSSDASGELGGSGAEIVSLKIGAFEVPTTPAGELWMHYTQSRPERVVPAWKILTDALSPAEMEKEFSGRIVFVGAGAVGLRDLVSTPMQDRDLGVMVHAQAVEQMILGKFVVRPDWALGLERALLLVFGLLMALSLPRLGATRGAILGLALVGGMLAGSWFAYSRQHYLLDPTYPVLALVLVYICSTGFTYYREERERAYIHHAFDRYLSPTLVKRIVDDPGQLELGGEEREMTVLFCDIRSFSRISETLSPKQIIRFLIAFLTPMCDILLDRKATIDKFIGDAILAFWNAPLDDPDQYANAARGALAMVARLEQLNIDMPAQGTEPWPGEVNIGIGLNAGPCCVGNMGSAQRLSYSLIGDTVNLASRIEGLTKYYGVRIAMGAALARHLPGFAIVTLDRVRVVGRDAPETVSALLGDETLAARPDYRAFAERHARMLDSYWAQDWVAAQALLDAGKEAAASHGMAKHYALMRDRIERFRASPPIGDWDGVFEATEK
ncbi:CHASE2 domain-containing protein [Sphingomonas sp. ERG5]|uniref:CHASE2 domain-containing protein n=1 Tax=Sphingomonas sp. ERG5 TaxID=1381597 RepID=UPI000AB51B78|nr:adenylate/guanylate cyclase domain-containing protein [Sphingomonas sp. ERG5]